MTKDEALDLALKSLEHMLEDAKQERLTVEYWNECVDAITAIKQARSAPVPTNCRHCGGADNVLCGGQCKVAATVQEPVAWKHDCAALLQNDVELWVDRCPHCGKPRTTPPAAVVNQQLTTEPAAPVQDSTCSEALRAQGKAYPRTCRKCGKGPCIALVNAALDRKAENARELGLDYEPAEVLGHNGWGFPIKAAAPVQKKCDCAAHSAADCVCGAWDKSAVAPVQEDWGPGPHEYHNLTAAPVQDIGVEQDERVFARIEARKNRDAAHKETAQRSWVGLTDEEVRETISSVHIEPLFSYRHVARAIEAKLKAKNG